MKIKKIQLKNGYKRFHNLTIDLGENPKRIIALVGPNGCGKSSVFDGLLFHNTAYQQIGNKGGKDYNYHSMNQIPNFRADNISIDFDIGNFISVRNQRQSSGKENTIFSFRSPYRYNSSLKVSQSKATTEIRLNNYGATTTSDLDEKMEENYRRLNIKFNKYLHENDCKPSEAKSKIIGDLNNSIKKCLDIEIISIGDIEAGKGTLFFQKEYHPKEFDFNVLSSGEKEVVDILLDLYLRQDEYNESIFLIDEPELHINTGVQRKLLIEINKLIGEKSQIWISTHSIGFLRALQEDFKTECQIIQFEKGVNYASEEKVLIPIKTNILKWREIFETALDDLTGLLAPKYIVYCEGKAIPNGQTGEEKGLDAIIYNDIFKDEFGEYYFVSSGGHGEVDKNSIIALKILEKAFIDSKILLFKDRDFHPNGNLISEIERKQELQKNNNLRILKRREIENYLFDFDILSKAYTSINKENYDKIIIDIINDDIKPKISELKSLCGEGRSISPDNWKKELSSFIVSDTLIYQELKSVLLNN